MEIWLEKMTPVLDKKEMSEILEEDEEKVNANYAACLQSFIAAGHL